MNISLKIDDYYIELFKNVDSEENAKLNTESPGWVVDRISILCLKIYHMKEQAERKDVQIEVAEHQHTVKPAGQCRKNHEQPGLPIKVRGLALRASRLHDSRGRGPVNRRNESH